MAVRATRPPPAPARRGAAGGGRCPAPPAGCGRRWAAARAASGEERVGGYAIPGKVGTTIILINRGATWHTDQVTLI